MKYSKMSAPMICVPGQRLCRQEDKLKAGRGTYTRNSFIYSSLAGPLTTTKNENGVASIDEPRHAKTYLKVIATSMDPDEPAHPHSLIRIHAVRFQTLYMLQKLKANSMDPDETARVLRLIWIHAGRNRLKTLVEVVRNVEENVVPTVDALVTARVTNTNPRFCKCAIIKVGRTTLKDSFRGMIRKEDVRATEKDKVEMYKCFRPGDIVIARVISLGDSQSYLLTTAENELGVVIATSEAGASLVPVSWNKMRCPKTLTEEPRKVAKVQPQFIEYSGT